MPASLPAEIFEMMTVQVGWEPFLGFDGHAEPSYGPQQQLVCWQEPHGFMADTGVSAFRRADGTVVEPQVDLLFSGDDPNARLIQLYDRFTPIGVGLTISQQLQAVHVATLFGPPFDNRNPWIIIVTL